MSSQVVREAFEAFTAANATVPYFPTLNEAPRQPGPRWCTLGFSQADVQRASLGAPALRRERGSVLVEFLTPSGQGDAEGMGLAEAYRGAIEDHQFSPGFYVEGSDSPFSMLSDDGTYFVTLLTVSYVYDLLR